MAVSPQAPSVLVPERNVFAHLQLRSETPPPNEKVLSYLEQMREPDNTPPRSLADPDEYMNRLEPIRNGVRSPPMFSPPPRSKASDTLLNTGGMFSPRKGSKYNGFVEEVEVEVDDVNSNAQDGVRSELEVKEDEPPPRPKYASYDSGPSFGNLGPLPPDEYPSNPYAQSSWKPNWPHIMNPQTNGQHWNGNENANHPNPGGLTSGTVISASPRQTVANIDGDPAARTKSPERDLTTSPRASSRAQSRAATSKEEPDQQLWSPRSKTTRITGKGTVYPPLPESKLDDDMYADGPGSPTKSRGKSKAPSLSPSDSPSQRASKQFANGTRSPPHGSIMSASHHNRPFSPYRHGPTQEDLLSAAVRGRSLVIPPSPEKELSVVSNSPSKVQSSQSRALSQMEKVGSHISSSRPPHVAGSVASQSSPIDRRERDRTPTRPQSPEALDAEEARIVNDALAARTPRTSCFGGSLQPDDTEHFHDVELCVLLQKENEANQHDLVKKALRKAIRQRIKKLGMKYDHESIKQYKQSHNHDPSFNVPTEYEEPPRWASDLKREIVLMQQRIESLGPKIDNLKNSGDSSFNGGGSRFAYPPDESTRTPMTQSVNIQTQPTGTLADSMYQQQETGTMLDDDGNVHEFETMTETQERRPQTDGEMHSLARSVYESEQARDDSPGHQYLEEQLYKLKQKPVGSQSAPTHRSWELAQHNDGDDDFEDNGNILPSNLPTIPDTNDDEGDRRSSRPLPELPPGNETTEMAVRPQGWSAVEYSADGSQRPPWLRIHSRLLNWAIIWPTPELENALNSTTRGQQVDEVALSIWTTQTYKRYVRAKLTDSPTGVVDRLFVPPNIADTINNAVFNGRHGDACGMLKDLWVPFGLEGMPRLIVVLARHRSDPNHWVVHRFSLPEGALTTYDSYPERTLPDGRPLGWWFSIRVAWPNAVYPSPDNLVQKMVRLHRPMQLAIDNSVAAAGIWRNVLMGSRAERSLDLERLRDLINTEVKNLKQRKNLGKLSIGAPRPPWEDMN